MSQHQHHQQAGFTILELMISTVVVSVILLLVTTVMIGIQSLYNKGINQENIQQNARTITDDVDHEIQTSTSNPDVTWVTPAPYTFTADFNGVSASYQVNAVCVGSVRYVYIVGLQVGTGSNQVAQGLWRDTTPSTGCGSTVPNIQTTTPSDGGSEYLAAGSRLTNFQISQQADGNYTLSVAIAIGADDLLRTNITPNPTCINGTGQQFCSTAALTTEAGQRVN